MNKNKVLITLPIYWQQTKKKKVLTGMSWYRNAHYHTQNKWKLDFHELIEQQIVSTKIKSPYKTELNIFYKNPTCDASNISALMEKVSLDSLQKLNITDSDSVKHHIGSSWNVVQQDKDNPRCEIVIYEV